MDTIIIILLLIIVAELTYLFAQTVRRKRIARPTGRSVFVDTSVLIDGRILAIARSGFISDTLMIPRSVVGELQLLADSADSEKRSRARHGLDVVTELQSMPEVRVEIFQDGSKAEEGVDERLLKLARDYHGVICTIDYNLNKVAHVEGLQVLNVNELAQTLRMAYLPGERMSIPLVQKGQGNNQAVGYLGDGTMVVVEQSSKQIGQTVEVEFIRALQTAAGKMMFAKLVSSASGAQKTEKRATKEKTKVVEPAKTVQADKVSQQPQVFHSDTKEQARHTKQRHQGGQQAPKGRRIAPKSAHKRPSSADNESRLLELVDKQ